MVTPQQKTLRAHQVILPDGRGVVGMGVEEWVSGVMEGHSDGFGAFDVDAVNAADAAVGFQDADVEGTDDFDEARVIFDGFSREDGCFDEVLDFGRTGDTAFGDGIDEVELADASGDGIGLVHFADEEDSFAVEGAVVCWNIVVGGVDLVHFEEADGLEIDFEIVATVDDTAGELDLEKLPEDPADEGSDESEEDHQPEVDSLTEGRFCGDETHIEDSRNGSEQVDSDRDQMGSNGRAVGFHSGDEARDGSHDDNQTQV